MIVETTRTIDRMPTAYNPEHTPYKQDEFSLQVCSAMDRNKISINTNITKTIFVGDVNVGKTAIVSKFCCNRYSDSYKATIGVDFQIENFKILNQTHNMQFWDTAGQERFKSIAQSYYRNTDVIVVVFDMTNDATRQTTTDWLNNVLYVNSMQKPLIFLVGCKHDILSAEQIEEVESDAFNIAEGMRAEYWTVSARTGYNITNLFQRIAALSFESKIIQTVYENFEPDSNIALGKRTNHESRCRCSIT